MSTNDNDALFRQFEVEFAALAAEVRQIDLRLTPIQAWVLISQIQLACRHPANTGPARDIAEQIARKLISAVAPGGALAIVAEQGWNPRYDVPRTKGIR